MMTGQSSAQNSASGSFLDEDTESGGRKWLRIVLITLVFAAFIGGLVYVVKGFLDTDKSVKKTVVQQIVLVKPPPPPPPPKPEVKPPEPKIKKEVIPPPEPKPDPEQPKPVDKEQPPEGKNLGLDAEGTAGSDGFGLIGNKGGADLLAGRMQFSIYTNTIQQNLREELSKSKKLQGVTFKAIVNLWLNASGGIKRFELVGSSGNAEVDGSLKTALSGIRSLGEAPPEAMPQPVKVRITSRRAG